jgi:uncharacterized protein with PQ loop repeat
MRHIMPEEYKFSALKGLDRWALIIGTIQPLMTIPQIWSVYSAHDASQISVITWMSYNIASIVLLLYGLKHKLLPIVVAQTLWLIVQTILVIATIIF